MAINLNRRTDAGNDFLGNSLEIGFRFDLADQSNEFIASYTAQRIGIANGMFNAFGDVLQIFIAGRMAQCVIDAFEVVEVNEKHAYRLC